MPGGRPPKPTALKLLHGDHKVHPERVNRREPVPSPGPIVPAYELAPRVRAVWDRLAPDRAALGLLSTWDVDAFSVLCEAVAVLQELRPGAPGYRDAVAVCTSIGGKFGWTPADRSRLVAGAGPGGDRGADLLS